MTCRPAVFMANLVLGLMVIGLYVVLFKRVGMMWKQGHRVSSVINLLGALLAAVVSGELLKLAARALGL